MAPAVVVAAAAACDEDYKACYEGDYVACTCGGDTLGYARCNANERFDACVCDGTTPGLDAGRESGAVAPACVPDAGVVRKYFEECTSNEECETCRCESFQGRGLCTTTCTNVTECAPPSDACTNRGVCRPPVQ
ncbi:MAG: hypothetical protein KIT84_29265 [Labilithrix sp.]|nr:hypothetical protein [Labilithrix sp.]